MIFTRDSFFDNLIFNSIRTKFDYEKYIERKVHIMQPYFDFISL